MKAIITRRVHGGRGRGCTRLFTWTRLWVSLLLGLCSGPQTQASPLTDGEKAVLRLAFLNDPNTLDPAGYKVGGDYVLFSLLYTSLLDITNGPKLVPHAAQSWSASPDQRIFRFRLQPGLQFSNGRKVVAADYVFAMERILNPATGSSSQIYLRDIRGAQDFINGKRPHVEGIRAPSPLELEIELGSGNPMFPFVLNGPCGTALPEEEVRRMGNAFAVNPVVSGPFRMGRWSRGSHLQLIRNPLYSGPTPARVDEVHAMVGGDPTTHLMMFERGEIDILDVVSYNGIPIQDLRRLMAHPALGPGIQRIRRFGASYVALNVEMPPLDNVWVRRAINHAIDRDRRMQVNLGFHEHAEGIIPACMPGYDPDLRGYEFNPDKARELLRKSGLQLPLQTELLYIHDEISRTQAQGIQWDLHQVGIEVDLKEVNHSQIWTLAGTRGTVPMALVGWNSGAPDNLDHMYVILNGSSLTNAGSVNLSYYNNPEVNRLMERAVGEVNLDQRRDLFAKAEVIVVRDAPMAFLGYMNSYTARQPWIHGELSEEMWGRRLDRVWIRR